MWFSRVKKETAERRIGSDRRKESRRKVVSHNFLGPGRCMNSRREDRRKCMEDRRGAVERELNKQLYGYIDKGWL